jgi:hypothetical protein
LKKPQVRGAIADIHAMGHAQAIYKACCMALFVLSNIAFFARMTAMKFL